MREGLERLEFYRRQTGLHGPNTISFRYDKPGFDYRYSTPAISHIIINGQRISVFRFSGTTTHSTRELPTNLRPANNGSLNINWEISPGTYLFSTRSGGNTNASIYRLPDNTKIGPDLSATLGASLTGTVPNITQPTKTTTYRLLATNAGGAGHKETTITVTQNPTITNLRRTGFSQLPDGTRFQFTARIKGYPMPTITWRFGNGSSSQRANDSIHCTAVQGQVNTWDCVWGRGAGIIHPLTTDSLVWTITNSSGTATARITNIGS